MAAKKTILVVDDDRDLVASTKAFLEARGYAVTAAHSGAEARVALQRELPDLVRAGHHDGLRHRRLRPGARAQRGPDAPAPSR